MERLRWRLGRFLDVLPKAGFVEQALWKWKPDEALCLAKVGKWNGRTRLATETRTADALPEGKAGSRRGIDAASAAGLCCPPRTPGVVRLPTA